MTEHDYSIETLVDRIHSSKTKEYFKEVLQTFYSGAYRSCIVTLYSVVICDLVFKLEELRDIYNDDTAKKILKEISDKQRDNPKNPDWETDILELVKTRTTLLELYEVEAVYQLQKQRHLSAHPVLTASSILYTPNRETITAHIKNMLVFILTKLAFFSKKLATNIINDIAENKDRLIINSDLKRYLEAKYFRNVKQDLYNNLFKQLWKFIFKLNNQDCIDNREVNLQTLEIIYNKDRNEIEKLIKAEQGSFEFMNDKDIISLFMTFLFDFPKIYQCLNTATQILVDAEISNQKKYKFISWFKFQGFDEYFEMIVKMVEEGYSPSVYYFSKVLKLAEQFGKKKECLDLAIELFGNSSSFDSADVRFSRFIEPVLNEFNETQLAIIIYKIDKNGQISSRRRASFDNKKVRASMQALNPGFDFSQFPDFQ